MQHTCAARDCTRQISTSLLMCPAHWRLVPKALKARVYESYGDYLRATKIGVTETVAAAERLREVQKEAVDTLAGNMPWRGRPPASTN